MMAYMAAEGPFITTYNIAYERGMQGRIKAQSFSFDQQFQAYQKDDFVLSFFQDPYVTTNLHVLSSNDKWCPVGVKATSVKVEPVPCTLTSMGFFNRLADDIVRGEEKYIKKCFDEFYEDFTISDELRKARGLLGSTLISYAKLVEDTRVLPVYNFKTHSLKLPVYLSILRRTTIEQITKIDKYTGSLRECVLKM